MTDRPDIHTLTGAYAVDALPEEEREVFEHHLVVCDPCAQEVAELQATAAMLGSVSHEPPPPSLRSRVLAEIDATRQDRPPVSTGEDGTGDDDLAQRGHDRAGRPRRWITNLAVAASVALLAAVGGLSYVVLDLNARIAQVETTSSRLTDVLASPDANVVSAVSPDGSVARVVASPTRGEAVFVADRMPSAPPDATYELWLIGEDGPVPAGLFDADERGRATRIVTGDLAAAAAIGVTVEPAGGSPQPTSDPIMVIELG